MRRLARLLSSPSRSKRCLGQGCSVCRSMCTCGQLSRMAIRLQFLQQGGGA